MQLALLDLKQTIKITFRTLPVIRAEIDAFKFAWRKIFNQITDNQDEEYHKNLISEFLKAVYYQDKFLVNVNKRQDLAIRLGNKSSDNIGVIMECKKPTVSREMIAPTKPNAKALHELVLYYLQESIDNNNHEVKQLIATNLYEWYIFDGIWFEQNIFRNAALKKEYESWKSSGNTTQHFYDFIAYKYLETFNSIPCTYVNILDYKEVIEKNDEQADKELINLYKLFAPEHLLKQPYANDSNTLNHDFYHELLYIMGLEEVKVQGKKLIQRAKPSARNIGSFLENTMDILITRKKLELIPNISEFGENEEQQLFGVALELCINWFNRILFLKLLESQLISYHNGDFNYAFLRFEKIKDFDELNELFFEVLAIPVENRKPVVVEKFGNLPYLNSSLFEESQLEMNSLVISGLKNRLEMPIFSQTVLKDEKTKRISGNKNTLQYLFEFLDAYDFGSNDTSEIRQQSKSIINAAVLGLIFEKINGYQDGAFFTPGFITMYMCRETIRLAVVQKFNEAYHWKCENFDQLRDKIDYSDIKERKKANKLINTIRICDPAVGSGHFLVSALNELIAIKYELRILSLQNGFLMREFSVAIENDELLLINKETNQPFQYRLNKNNRPIDYLQEVQECIFHEKQIVIENCLFGADINPKSVMICRLRLWIELLKSMYYKEFPNHQLRLETLPNLDINIKVGNSLISRFPTNFEISNFKNLKLRESFIHAYKQYAIDVFTYKHCRDYKEKSTLRKRMAKFKDTISELYLMDQKEYLEIKEMESQLGVIVFDFFKHEKTKTSSLTTEIEEKRTTFFEKYGQLYGKALEWRFEFPEILDEDGNFIGFDVVIGNPPYIVTKGGRYTFSNIQAGIINYFKSKYKTGQQQINTYTLFIELSQLIQKRIGSYTSLIIPNTFLANEYSVELRNFLLNNCSILEIRNNGLVFDEATVETLVLILQEKQTNNISTKVSIKNKTHHINLPLLSSLTPDKKFLLLLDSITLPIIQKLNHFPKLEKYAKVWRGLTTGNDKKYISTNPLNNDYYPLLTGADIKKYAVPTASKYIWYLPNELDRARDERIFLLPTKLVSKFVGDKLTFALDEQKHYVLNSCCITEIIDNSFSIKALLAILNSKLLNFYFQYVFTDYRETFPIMKSGNLENLPIVKPNEVQTEQLEYLVNEILKKLQANLFEDAKIFEHQIDQIIYQLYKLNEEEIAVVENHR